MTASSPFPSSASATHPPLPVLALVAALVGGLMSAVQSRLNSRLAVELHDGFTAASVSFGSGLVLVALLVAARAGTRRAARQYVGDLRDGTFPSLYALGGAGGALFVLGQGLSVALLGVALFIVCVVAGQTVTGLVVDRYGLGPGGPRQLTGPRVVAAVLMVASVAIAMSGQLGSSTATLPWWVLCLPVVAGVAMGVQQAVNGRVSAHTGEPLVATLGNFVVGTLVLVAAAIVRGVATGHGPGRPPANPALYLGGAIGVVYIAMAARLVHRLGVLTLAMGTIAGQIIGSVALDALVPADREHLTWATLVGAGLTLVAALIAAGLHPRRRG